MTEDAVPSSGVTAAEVGTLRVGVRLRTGCRRALEGDGAMNVRRLGEELERRE